MQFNQEIRGLLGGVDIGTRHERTRIREALSGFFARMGYTAELGSYNQGTLLIHAAPAEHALLRYDLPSLRRHLDSEGLSSLVRQIKVRTQAIKA